MPAPSHRYTTQHFQDFAVLLAAEREQNGPSPALNRITAAITRLLAENSASFNRELFGKAARGNVPVTTRPRRKEARSPGPHTHRQAGQRLTHEHEGGDTPHGYYEHPEDAPSDRPENTNWAVEEAARLHASGWTPPVIVTLRDEVETIVKPVQEDEVAAIMHLLNSEDQQS